MGVCGSKQKPREKKESKPALSNDVVEYYTKKFRDAVLMAISNRQRKAFVHMLYGYFPPHEHPDEFAKALEILVKHDYDYIFTNNAYELEITWPAEWTEGQMNFISGPL